MKNPIKRTYRMLKDIAPKRQNDYMKGYRYGYLSACTNIAFNCWLEHLGETNGGDYYHLYKALDKLQDKEITS